MRRPSLVFLAALFMALLAWPLAGCNGTGIEVKLPDISDTPPGSGGPGGPGGPGNGDPPPSGALRFRGTFVTSYTDDFAGTAIVSPSEYAARIALDQTGAQVTGSGQMARFFRTGTFNNSQFEFTLSGSAAPGSNDGLLTFRNRQNRNDFDRIPIWVMRRAGGRLVGIYGEFSNTNQLVRSGHAVWTSEQEAQIGDTWIATGQDTFAVEGLSPLDRTLRVELTNPSGNTVSGAGGFVEQPLNDTSQATNFTVIEGARQDQRIGLRLGGPELGETEFQHMGFYTNSVMHTAYGQFRNRQNLLRLGATTWVRGRTPEPAAINGNWVAAFSDSRTGVEGLARTYLTVLQLEVGEENVITGSGFVLDETDESEVTFRSANVVDSAIVGGTRIRLTLNQPRATFEWDLRVGFGTMVGTYRRLSPQGAPTGVGHAVFYRPGPAELEGTWTAAFVDRVHEIRAPETQLAIVEISEQTDSGTLTGTGRLQFAAEIDDLERVFSVTGNVRAAHPSGQWIEWTWRGSDIAGDTVWNLRQQNNIMVGTYTNFTQNGALESRGHAVWYR